MKEKLNTINQQFKEFILDAIILERNEIIEFLENNLEDYHKLNSVEKLVNIRKDINLLSLFNDSIVISFLESLGVNSYVTKYFASLKDTFAELDKLSVSSKFLFPYTFILDVYYVYSQMFFNAQLCSNFGFKYGEILKQLKRQEKNNNLPNEFAELYKKYLEETSSMSDRELILKIPVPDGSIISLLKKTNNFPHKVYFRDLYDKLFVYNEEIIINTKLKSDFKCDFYDLFKILYRDKMFFKNDNEKELTYGKPGNRRFKIKQVERLILS